MIRFNKLSIETLTEAFSEEEAKDGRVFVIFGTKDTLTRLRVWWNAARPGNGTSTIWGALLVESPALDEGKIMLGLHRSQEAQIGFFEAALRSGLRGEEVTNDMTVWGAIKSFD